MAVSGPPRIARVHVNMPTMRPRDMSHGGGAKAQIPSAGGGGGGLAQSFGASGARGEDPALSGDFERDPTIRWLGFPIGGGGLSERGKEQQALNQRLQQYNRQIQSATQQGATFQEAFRGLARSNPEALNDLMGHPTALQSMANLAQVLGTPQHTLSGVTPQGQQIEYDENGRAVGTSEVPGFRGAPDTKQLVPVTTDIDPKTGRQTISYSNYDKKTGLLTPTLGPGGEQATGMKAGKAGAQSDMIPSDIAGLPPQVSADEPKTRPNRISINTLTATPDVMKAIQRMSDAAGAMGLVKGPLASLSGQYFGVNGTGAQFKADRDLIQSQANKMTGSTYAGVAKNFMEGIGSASDAPSFIKLQSSQMLHTLRNEAQSLADQESLGTHGKLAPTLAKQLGDVGIVPNGYQNQKFFDGLPAGSEALWKSRYQPDALTDTDRHQLLTDAANGKFGSPKDPQNQDPDLKNVKDIYQKYQTQKAAQSQQATASTAARAAQPSPSNVPPAGVPAENPPAATQPASGAESGAAQPQGQPQGQQQQQQQPQQPAAPDNLQQNGQQGQTENPQGSAQAPLPAGLAPGGVLMPPTAVPGQPAQGMPATNATTPQPPPSPLPQQTSQMLTPQGGVPTPATQAPLVATNPATVKDHYIEAPVEQTSLPDGGASAPIPEK